MKPKFTLCYLLFAFFATSAITSKAQVKVLDSLILVDFYYQTGGPHWLTQTNWLTSEPLQNWYGVTVFFERVIGISLTGNNLRGKIPISLSKLSQLTTLNLGSNLLVGNIPPALGNIRLLAILHLDNNQLTGEIPSSLGNTNLYELNLLNNHLSGHIPSSLGNLYNLYSIELFNNQLTGSIPSSLGNLTNLTDLILSNNQLQGSIPSSLGNLVNLYDLGLSNNLLSGQIPESLGNLSQLLYLQLSYNHLSGNIPSSLGKLSNLNILTLDHNTLTGKIPSSLSDIPYLNSLWLNNNKLSGAIPNSLTKIPLQNLDISNNAFTFAGMEPVAQTFSWSTYSPQASIPLYKTGRILSVTVGGKTKNNTFYWYRNGLLDTIIYTNPTFLPRRDGNYSVSVTNSIAIQLTLYSDTTIINTNNNNSNYSSIAALSNMSNKFSVYPNPAIDHIVVSMYSTVFQPVEMIVLSVDGKVQQKINLNFLKGNNTQSIELNYLPAGLYQLNVLSGDGILLNSKKFIKQCGN